MPSPFQSLIEILQRELTLYSRLEDLLGEELVALTEVQTDRLMTLVNEKDGLALQLKALEESRRLAVETIAQQCGLDDSADLPRLRDIASVAPQNERIELLQIAEDLQGIAERGQANNAKNRFLVNRSLEMVRETVRALAQPDDTQKTYQPQGGLKAYPMGAQVVARRA